MPQAWRLTRSSGEDKPYVNKPAPWSEDSQYFERRQKHYITIFMLAAKRL
jgi:hypothetical protein